jgi:hypothetical protein
MTSAPVSTGAAPSAVSASATPTSISSAPVPHARTASAPTSISSDSDPRSGGASSLYALAIQVKDIDGEIALAAELLESDDPAERETAANLIEEFLVAAHHSRGLLLDKADRVAGYVDHLRGIAQFRKAEAERLAALAAADARRAESLTSYLINVLTKLNPGATKFSLPTHEISSRRSTKVVIDDEDLIPEAFRKQPPERRDMPPVKADIKAAIAGGTAVPGACLQTNTSWSIK